MQFNLNRELARMMARRLRKAVGAETLTQARSLEVLSMTLGLPNWDTLSGMLKGEETGDELQRACLLVAPVLAAPVDLYLEARVTDSEYGNGANWARLELSNPVLELLARKANQCRLNDDLGVRLRLDADEWDESEELNHRTMPAAVTKDDFWLRANPKHSDYFVETRRCPLERLFRILETGTSDGADFKLAGGALFYAADKAQSLMWTLEEQGRLSFSDEDLA
jgi:hypothetical protein